MIKEPTMENISLPVGWEMKKLANVLNIQNGYAFNSKLFSSESGIPLIRIRDIKKGIDTVIKYTGEYDKKYEVNSGDFLIGMDGEFGCYEWKGEKALLNQRVCRLQDFNKIDSKFLFYGINKYLKDIEDVTTFTTVKHISSSQIKNIQFPLPPLPQQKQIVSILDKAFAAIDIAKANAEQNLQNAKEFFENTLQILFDNKNWEHKKLGEIASFKNGMNFTKSSKGQSIEIVGVKNFKNKFWVPFEELETVILDGEMSEGYQLKKGDIITVRSNGNPQLIGRTLLADEVNGNVSHSGFTIRIRLNPNTILPVFLCHYLKTTKTRKELVESGNGIGIKSLNQGSLSSLMIPYAQSEEEQKLIVNKIEGISIQTKKLEAIYTQKIADLEEMKKSILQKAFSGQLNTQI